MQNQAVFRDQQLLLEMRQTARAALSQIAGDIGLAGQGVPRQMEHSPDGSAEGTAAVLPGSNDRRIHIRAGYSNVEARVLNSLPVALVAGVPHGLSVESTAAWSTAMASGVTGRFAFLTGDSAVGPVWVRAAVVSLSGAGRTITVVPFESNSPTLHFTTTPVLALEEAIAISFDAATRSIRRSTATDMQDLENIRWTPAHETAAGVIDLVFQYRDRTGAIAGVDTAEERSSISSVEVRLVTRTATPLSNGTQPTYAVSIRVAPRNIER
jgi:hypothetical protein